MKKLFFFAALAASMSLMAQAPSMEFHYNKTAGDQNAAGTAFTTSDKVAVDADEVIVAGTNFTVKNAYATTYKSVGMTTDTAYTKMVMSNGTNEIEVDFSTTRIQGQDNPKDAAGGNPGTTNFVPVQGACYKMEVQQDGYIIVFVKATPNKNQFVFEDVVTAGSAKAGTAMQYDYLLMSHNTGTTEVGDPNGCLMTRFQGDADRALQTSPQQPCQLYNASYSINGLGVLIGKVEAEYSPYIFGTGGSKMMAAGFAWVSDTVGLNITVKGNDCTAKEGFETNFDDVQLLPLSSNLKVQDCGVALNEFNLTAYVPYEWFADTVGCNGSVKKCAAYIWEEGQTGKFYEMNAMKDATTQLATHKYTVTYKTAATSFNAIFVNAFENKVDWNGDINQTVDILGITGDACYNVTANLNAKASATLIADCAEPAVPTAADIVNQPVHTTPATAVENVATELNAVKVIENGHLYIIKNGVKYNALGAVVE